jgi:hypothetical protein
VIAVAIMMAVMRPVAIVAGMTIAAGGDRDAGKDEGGSESDFLAHRTDSWGDRD